MRAKNHKVCGIGINDYPHPIKVRLDGGKTWRNIPAYDSWNSMFTRCYGKRSGTRMCYIGCTVDQRWHRFSAFKEWYDSQYKETGWQLDKDILKMGNKVYCPEFCIFVPPSVNSIFAGSKCKSPKFLPGVKQAKPTHKFMSMCRNPFTKKEEHLGWYYDEESAHLAWVKRKETLALALAVQVSDARLRDAILTYDWSRSVC